MNGEQMISTAETARRLGVKVATVYAYVSRGLLPRHRVPGHHGSVFDPDDVEALTARGQAHRGAVGALESIRTAVSTTEGDHLYYRGRDVEQLVRTSTFEAVADLLWSGDGAVTSADAGGAFVEPAWPSPPPELVARSRTAADALPPCARAVDRLRVAVAVVGAHAGRAGAGTSAVDVVDGARTLLGVMVDSLTPQRPPDLARDTLAQRLWPALTGGEPEVAGAASLDAALVLLAEHGLAVATVAARLASSTGADLCAVVLAGLAAGNPEDHAGTGSARATLLAATTNASAALSAARRTVPVGFGHPIYPAVDPRARCLLALLPDGPVADALDALVTDVALSHGAFPTMDLALAALTLTHDMRPDAAETIFSCARTAGWVAHALEETDTGAERAAWTGRYRMHGLYDGRATDADPAPSR